MIKGQPYKTWYAWPKCKFHFVILFQLVYWCWNCKKHVFCQCAWLGHNESVIQFVTKISRDHILRGEVCWFLWWLRKYSQWTICEFPYCILTYCENVKWSFSNKKLYCEQYSLLRFQKFKEFKLLLPELDLTTLCKILCKRIESLPVQVSEL
jgi:hypothetical protein